MQNFIIASNFKDTDGAPYYWNNKTGWEKHKHLATRLTLEDLVWGGYTLLAASLNGIAQEVPDNEQGN